MLRYRQVCVDALPRESVMPEIYRLSEPTDQRQARPPPLDAPCCEPAFLRSKCLIEREKPGTVILRGRERFPRDPPKSREIVAVRLFHNKFCHCSSAVSLGVPEAPPKFTSTRRLGLG